MKPKFYYVLVLLALAAHGTQADNLFVAAGGDIYKFDTTIGAASQSTFNSQSTPPTGDLDSLVVDTNGNVLAGYYNSNNGYGFIDEFASAGGGGLYPSTAVAVRSSCTASAVIGESRSSSIASEQNTVARRSKNGSRARQTKQRTCATSQRIWWRSSI